MIPVAHLMRFWIILRKTRRLLNTIHTFLLQLFSTVAERMDGKSISGGVFPALPELTALHSTG